MRKGAFGSLGRLASGIFANDAQTLGGRAFQFVVNAALGTIVSVAVLKVFFPGFLSHAPEAPALTTHPSNEGLG